LVKLKKREFVSEKLLKALLEDKEYKKYIKYYERTKEIDGLFLLHLVDNHLELVKLFFYSHILLYSSPKGLEKITEESPDDEINDDIKKAKDLFIEDIMIMHVYYQKNYERVRAALKAMCKYKIVSKKDRAVIKSILNLDTDKELKYMHIYVDE